MLATRNVLGKALKRSRKTANVILHVFLIELGIPFDLNIIILNLGEGTLVFS